MTNYNQIENYIRYSNAPFSLESIMDFLDISAKEVEAIIQQLLLLGKIKKIAAAPRGLKYYVKTKPKQRKHEKVRVRTHESSWKGEGFRN